MLIVHPSSRDDPLTRYEKFQIALATSLVAAILFFLITPYVEWLLGWP